MLEEPGKQRNLLAGRMVKLDGRLMGSWKAPLTLLGATVSGPGIFSKIVSFYK